MKRAAVFFTALASIAVWGTLAVGPDARAQQPADLVARLTRTGAGGGITVKAIYAVPEYFKTAGNSADVARFRPDTHIVILLSLDTHAGDLRSFDPTKGTVLRNDRGQQVIASRWEVISDGAHHRAGAVLFPKADAQGKSLEDGARVLELVVRGLGGVPERVLKWDLPVR